MNLSVFHRALHGQCDRSVRLVAEELEQGGLGGRFWVEWVTTGLLGDSKVQRKEREGFVRVEGELSTHVAPSHCLGLKCDSAMFILTEVLDMSVFHICVL